MHFIIRTSLTIIILLLLPLVIFQFLLGYGGSIEDLWRILMMLISPFRFGPLFVGIIILSSLHHSSLARRKKRQFGITTVLVLIALRIFMFFRLGDGSWGSLGFLIFGAVEFLCYILIGILFGVMNRIAANKRNKVRLGIFFIIAGIFTLQCFGYLRPGLIE